MKVYYDKDTDIKLIRSKKVAIMGYGSQGIRPCQQPEGLGCERGRGPARGKSLRRQGEGRTQGRGRRQRPRSGPTWS